MPPSANVYWRTWAWIDRVTGIAKFATYVSTEAKEYKNTVRTICIKNRVKKQAGEIALYLKVYRPRRVGDLSNRIKCLEDALQGFAYENDSQIVKIVAERHDDKTNPRVEVAIEVVSEQLSMKMTEKEEVPF